MLKEIIKKQKSGIGYCDDNYNWKIVGKEFVIYDKNFNHKFNYWIKDWSKIKKIFDILGNKVKVNSVVNKLTFNKNDTILSISCFEDASNERQKREYEYTHSLTEMQLKYAYDLKNKINSDSAIDIGAYIGFKNNYIFKTDSYQLGYYTLTKEIKQEFSLHESIIEILNMIKEFNIIIKYDCYANIRIETDNYIIETHNKQLPNLISLIKSIDKKDFIQLNFKSKELINVLKICDKIAIDNISMKHAVKMYSYGQQINFLSKNQDMEIEKYISYNRDFSKRVKIQFNIKFLLHTIQEFKEDEFTLYYKNSCSLMFTEKENYTYVFMLYALKDED